MRNPFPGMNPYLEDPAYCAGFHTYLIVDIASQLGERLPEPYVADVGERVYLVSVEDAAATQYVPDVILFKDRPGDERRNSAPAGTGGLATLEPVAIPSLEGIEMREHFVEIRRDQHVVTTIELLSPANKVGEGIGQYRSKRRALVAGGVNVVEIDLLRRGARTRLAEPLPDAQYYAFVFFGDRRPNVDVYAWSLRSPLPRLPIPLQAGEEPVALDLAGAFGGAFARGQYGKRIQYDRGLPPPPLTPEDVKWAAEVMASVRS